MPKLKIAKIGPGTKRVQREKPEAYKTVERRIAAARKEKGMPDLDISLLGRIRRSTVGRGAQKVHTPQTAETRRQLKKK